MPIQVVCTCGKKLKAPDSLAGRVAKCPKCEALIDVPIEFPIPVMEAIEPEPPITAPPPEPRVPSRFEKWAKDPVVLFGTLVPVIVAVIGGIYIARDRQAAKHRAEIKRLHETGRRLIEEKKPLEGYQQLGAAIQLAKTHHITDADTVSLVTESKSLFEQVRAEAEAEQSRRDREAQARRDEEEAKRVAAIRASLRWDLTGSINLETKDGRVRPLSDISVRLLPRTVTFENMGNLGLGLLTLEQHSLKTKRDLGPVIQAFLLTRAGILDKEKSGAENVRDFTADRNWTQFLFDLDAPRTTTDAQGRFSFRNIPDGEYCVYAKYRNEYSYIEWLRPVDIHEDAFVELINSNSAINLDAK